MSVYCPVAVSIIVWFVLCAWITRFQPLSYCTLSETVTTYGFRSDERSGFSSIPLSPSSFFTIFTILSIWLSVWFQLFACLIGAAFSRICVVSCFFIFLPQAFVYSFFFFSFSLSLFFFFFFCRRHLRSVSFSACLALVLVFRVSAYPSFLGRQWCCDLRSCSVEIKRKSVWSFVLSHHL